MLHEGCVLRVWRVLLGRLVCSVVRTCFTLAIVNGVALVVVMGMGGVTWVCHWFGLE